MPIETNQEAVGGNADRDWVLIRNRVDLLRSQEPFRQQNKSPSLPWAFMLRLTGSLGSATLPLLIILLIIYVLAALRRVLLGRILRSLLLS
jgi:hypothetical protein